MGFKKLLSLFILFFSVCSYNARGQVGWDASTLHSNNRFFYGVTYGILPDIEKSPIKIYPNYVSDNTVNPPFPERGDAVVFAFNTNFVSFGGKIRYNLIEFNPRISVSVSTAPSFGAGFTVVDEPDVGKMIPYMNCSYNIPLMIEFNYGSGATHNCYDEYGIFAFAGIENTGLLFKDKNPDGDIMDINGNYYAPDFINNWTEATFGLGVRYSNKRHVKREVFLKYGVGPSTLYEIPYQFYTSIHPWTLKLTLVRNF